MVCKNKKYQIINKIAKDMSNINSEILNILQIMLQSYTEAYQLYLYDI